MPSSSFNVTCGSSSSSAMRCRRNSRSTRSGRHGHDRGAPRLRVDRRELAEEVPGQHGADLLPLAHDLALALQHHEQGLARLAFANHRLAGPEGELVGVARQPLQVPLGEVGEHRHARERRGRLTLRSRDAAARVGAVAGAVRTPVATGRESSGSCAGAYPAPHTGREWASDRGRCRRPPLGWSVWTRGPASRRCSAAASPCSTAPGVCCCRAAASPRRSSAAIASPSTITTSRATPTC